MDPQSPPKRMTRARAAAKAGETGLRTTRVITAAAKAKMMPAPAPTKPAVSAKRKTRSDDAEHDEEHTDAAVSTRATRPRGRPKKTNSEESEEPASASMASAPGRATRARAAARKAAAEAPKPEPVKVEPPKATRGRPRKTPAPAEAAEVPKRTTSTRSRASTLTSTKPAPSKRVTFEEPEKENVDPTVAKKDDKAPATAGLRGRPVRKPPVPKATRITSRTSAASDKETKMPLSPRKLTQMSLAPDMSEDELTADAPVKPMMKSPVKPPSGSLGSLKKATPEQPEIVEPTADAEDDDDDMPAATIASPARRPPSSPYKDTMKSPAKRSDGAVLFKSAPSLKSGSDSQATPFKSSLLNSPAKRPQSAMKGLTLPSVSRNDACDSRSPMKMSLLQSPAKRPTMPIKSFPTPARRDAIEEADSSEDEESQPSPSARRSPVHSAKTSSEKLMLDEQEDAMHQLADELLPGDTATLQFPGRLSAVLPRYADPALKDNTAVLYQKANMELVDAAIVSSVVPEAADAQDVEEEVDGDGDSFMTDEPESPSQEVDEPTPMAAATTRSPPKQMLGAFGLRDKDTNPYQDMDSESEDELASGNRYQPAPSRNAVPATPTPKSSRRSIVPPPSTSLGFTPLAQQFSTWVAQSPAKKIQPLPAQFDEPETEPSPVKTSYFEDEMTVRSAAGVQNEITIGDLTEVGDPEFNDMLITAEDMELAAEADEMSLMEPEQFEQGPYGHQGFDDSVSDASQEYGDENEVPVDPALLQQASVPPKTPRRILHREYHTVSKVPLKGADESSPRPKKKKRSASISRLPVSRPTHGLTRSATVISYSPSRRESTAFGAEASAPTTPKSEAWSAVSTPARTPRRDANPTLLSGAVVFVDVHTSEGADASGIFVELLSQMGARCVKQWAWNPDSEPGTESSRIGITHVVYKDGGRRTMEKVRQTGGVVQCVGVSWVLDCERENQWLDEAPYYIDTEIVPRGGSRRRKSMEPKMLANMNGQLVSSPEKSGRDTCASPNTPANRRDSTAWMRTPSDESEGFDQDWHTLTPVPVTPAPDALARYAANVTPETPTADFEFDSPTKAMLMQTCPPKASEYSDMGEGILERRKDEGVMMRLMAARRKSLQFAPKVGSPLARAWK